MIDAQVFCIAASSSSASVPSLPRQIFTVKSPCSRGGTVRHRSGVRQVRPAWRVFAAVGMRNRPGKGCNCRKWRHWAWSPLPKVPSSQWHRLFRLICALRASDGRSQVQFHWRRAAIYARAEIGQLLQPTTAIKEKAQRDRRIPQTKIGIAINSSWVSPSGLCRRRSGCPATSAVMPKQPVVQPTAVSAMPTVWPPFFHLRSRRRSMRRSVGCGLLMASPACAESVCNAAQHRRADFAARPQRRCPAYRRSRSDRIDIWEFCCQAFGCPICCHCIVGADMSGPRLSGYRAVSCRLRPTCPPLRTHQSAIGPQFFISSAARILIEAAVMMPPA